MQIRLSVIIPALNEASHIGALLAQLDHPAIETIVVDGGSDDETLALAGPLADKLLRGQRGRAVQMNIGAVEARGEWLWFLHADSVLCSPIEDYLAVIEEAADWGFFPVRLSGGGLALRIIERAMACRSRWTAVATGDQGLFIRRGLFQTLGGFEALPLMEDVALSKRLRLLSSPVMPQAYLQTSSRRWEQRGVWQTVFLMWRLRLLYFLGVSPQYLARQYK